ncbi:hypothetical protein [Pseudomarimonas arenosa]|uniref:TIGR03016 family PEP-CTERM system-associated outer membrane protein n=1 Tax=Pseudomarimonas arenosa TaxID=2774145 RepID=A0AAW3ZFF5_9GAMM|nr:hypothetical protein [Pseudomarimonas arenosa]MBD8524848.1 hypothetical protein [Pseudomarimonas arenosa]
MLVRLNVAIALVLSTASFAANAVQLNYRLDLQYEDSSNVARSRIADAGNVLAARLGFAAQHQGERLALAAAGDLQRRQYHGVSFADETYTRLGVLGRWTIAPERLSFALQESSTEQPIDGFSIDRPNNRQRVDVLVAGPTLTLRPSARSRLLLEGRRTLARAEQTREFDSDRNGVDLRGLLNLGDDSSLSANVEWSEIDFRQSPGVGNQQQTDYRRLNGFLRYQRNSARSAFAIDLGASDIRRDAGLDGLRRDQDAPLIRINAQWQLSNQHVVEAQLQSQLSDATADALAAAPRVEDFEQPIALREPRATTVNADLFEEQAARLGWTHNGASNRFRFDLYHRQQNYQFGDQFDQSIDGLGLGVQRQIRARWAAGVFAAVEQRDYDNLQRQDRDRRYGLNLNFQRTAALSFGLELSRQQRDSDDPSQPYRDDRLLFTLSYRR